MYLHATRFHLALTQFRAVHRIGQDEKLWIGGEGEGGGPNSRLEKRHAN